MKKKHYPFPGGRSLRKGFWISNELLPVRHVKEALTRAAGK